MYEYFMNNINVENSGAVCAAPKNYTGYYWHWARDAALTMKTFMYLNDF